MKNLEKDKKVSILNEMRRCVMAAYWIEQAKPEDLASILRIYARARAFMAESGNPTQWKDGYPDRELLAQDIRKEKLYVVKNGDRICGVFFFHIGEDPTYGYMENGAWRSNDPYGTIHRIASDGSGGIFPACLEFCRSKIGHIRIDTHHDNKPMQHVVEKHGFSRRGIIYVQDGSPRIAYDLI